MVKDFVQTVAAVEWLFQNVAGARSWFEFAIHVVTHWSKMKMEIIVVIAMVLFKVGSTYSFNVFIYVDTPKITLMLNTENPDEEAKAVRVRRYGELVVNAVSSVASALEIPKEMIKDSVRPDYWAKDSESPSCTLCKQMFGNNDDMNQSELFYRETSTGSGSGTSSQGSPVHNIIDIRRHHCRGCGTAVCNKCSMNRKPVPEHGWATSVRGIFIF